MLSQRPECTAQGARASSQALLLRACRVPVKPHPQADAPSRGTSPLSRLISRYKPDLASCVPVRCRMSFPRRAVVMGV